MKYVSALLKPASGKCNIRCEYCFYADEAKKRLIPDYGIMSEETLEEIIRKVMDIAEEGASFAYQGGEPTLCGLDFFRKAVEFQKKHNTKGITLSNGLQTNGILIDDEWADFLHENNFLVGLSLDGTQEIHDRYRKLPNGNGSFESVMNTARRLKEHQVDTNVLFTVTKDAAKKPEKLYQFFSRCGFDYLQFMPCLDPLEERPGSYRYSLLPSDYGYFLIHLFDCWYQDIMSDRPVSIRYFDNLCCIAAGLPAEACSMRGGCSCQFIFEADGSCYPCDFYVSEEWLLGNIADCTLEELYASENCRRFIREGSIFPDDCRKCKWARVCRGGCRRNRDDVTHQNFFCKSFSSFLDARWDKVRMAAAYILRKNQQKL